MKAGTIALFIGLGTILLAVIAGGFFLIYSVIQSNNAQTQAEIAAQQSNSGGLGGLIGGILALL